MNTRSIRIVRDWEAVCGRWAQPPGKTEESRCENAVGAIRNAIAGSPALRDRGVKVFVQGSYRNRVNVRQDSDVDVGVMCHDVFLSQLPAGRSQADFGIVDAAYGFAQFKGELEDALVAYFGRGAVTRGNKAFDIKANTYHVEADVVPLFEFRQYRDAGRYRAGVALLPDDGSGRIENYPERLLETWPNVPLHYENGVSKNEETGRRFKGMVRILKSIRNEMDERGDPSAKPIPGYLLECLAWNAPVACFDSETWIGRLRALLLHLWASTKESSGCASWCEVDGIKYLFHGSQPWKREQAHAFVGSAWEYVGVLS